MPKIGRTLSYINTERKGKSTEQSPVTQSLGSSRPGGSISMSQGDYLLKSIWDKVFEIRTDSQGREYIFGKLPMVTQYGITMYSGDGVNVPSLASGLPFDGRTIWYNPDTQQIEVIGGTGGGSGEGVSNFWDLSGIPSWITNSKPKYTYSEIEGTPDLSGFATQNWIISQGYASAEELKKYIPISGYTEVSGEKNFTGGLKVNGSPIYYDTEKKYWKLEGDLLVTGGVTMYGSDSSFVPSTIMDAILYDSATLGINSNGQLYVKGGTSGGGLDITALQNYLTSNSYLNVTGGDNRYLQLSGGTINGTSPYPLVINTTDVQSGIQFLSNNDLLGVIVNGGEYGTALINFKGKYRALGIDNDGNAYTTIDYNNTKGILLHSANYSSYALPLSGGTLTNTLTIDNSNVGLILHRSGQATPYIRFGQDANNELGELGVYNDGRLVFWPLVSSQGGYNQWNTVWHSGNDGSGSGLDADTLDGYHVTHFMSYVKGSGYVQANLLNSELWSVAGGDGYIEYYDNGTWFNSRWGKVMAHYGFEGSLSGNASSATKLQTPRTIWGQSFDGTGNVSGVISGVDGISFNSSYAIDIDYNSNFVFKYTHLQDWSIQKQDTTKIFMVRNDGNVGIGTATPKSRLSAYAGVGERPLLGNLGQINTVEIGTAGEYGTYFWTEGSGSGFIQQGRTDGNATAYNLNLQVLGGNVGIGTASPQQKLHVVGNIWSSGDVGAGAKIHAFGNLIANGRAGIGLENPTTKLHVLESSTHTAAKFETYATQSALTITKKDGISWAIGVGIKDNGDSFGWWTTTGQRCAASIDVSGNFWVNGGITMYSDQRKKTILNHVELSLKQIAEAPLIEHYYNGDDKKTTHVGSIAQYWANMNDWFCKLDSEGYYTMEIQNAALASAISIARELDRYETKTDKDIKKLKKRICELEEEVERLKSA